MNTREIASEYRIVQWSQTLQEQAASGESIKEFCRKQGSQPEHIFLLATQIARNGSEANDTGSSGAITGASSHWLGGMRRSKVRIVSRQHIHRDREMPCSGG